LAADPPVLASVPQRLQVFGDGRVALHLALPQVVEPGVLREGGQRHVEVGEVDAPGVARVELLDFRAVERAQLPAHALFSFGSWWSPWMSAGSPCCVSSASRRTRRRRAPAPVRDPPPTREYPKLLVPTVRFFAKVRKVSCTNTEPALTLAAMGRAS